MNTDKKWFWLKRGNLKRETESLKFAAQEQALRTNLVKAAIEKSQTRKECRMCGKADEVKRPRRNTKDVTT